MAVKWDVLRIWCAHLRQPHEKYCICIDWPRQWFFYINSEPPAFRRARLVAVEVSNFEIQLPKDPSYIDTTTMVTDIDPAAADSADNDYARQLGPLLPTVRQRIVAAVRGHGALDPAFAHAVLDGEP